MKTNDKTMATPSIANTTNGITSNTPFAVVCVRDNTRKQQVLFRYPHGYWAEAKQTSENAGKANVLERGIRRICLLRPSVDHGAYTLVARLILLELLNQYVSLPKPVATCERFLPPVPVRSLLEPAGFFLEAPVPALPSVHFLVSSLCA
jgi:hypothetical protein